MPTRHVLSLGFLLACGGATAQPTATPAASSAPSASASVAPSASSSVAVAPVEERAPLPANYRLVTGDGFSIYAPSAWLPLQVPPGALAFRSPGGDDEGMSLQIAKVAFVGPESEFVSGTTQGATNRGATQTGSSTLTIAGRAVPITAFTASQPGSTIRGAIRATTGSDNIVLVTCHTIEASWNDKARAQCDPIFSSLRLGAAAKAAATAPPGKRFLTGQDFRVTIPATWTDIPPHTTGVHALAQSTADEQTMVVITIREVTPDDKPTPQNRDAILQKAVKIITQEDVTHATVKHTAPNAVDLDFTRKLEGPTTALVLAHFFAKDAAYLVTCGGLRQTMETHRDICETSVRSMRLEHAK